MCLHWCVGKLGKCSFVSINWFVSQHGALSFARALWNGFRFVCSSFRQNRWTVQRRMFLSFVACLAWYNVLRKLRFVGIAWTFTKWKPKQVVGAPADRETGIRSPTVALKFLLLVSARIQLAVCELDKWGWTRVRCTNVSVCHYVQVSCGVHPFCFPACIEVTFLCREAAGALMWPLTHI